MRKNNLLSIFTLLMLIISSHAHADFGSSFKQFLGGEPEYLEPTEAFLFSASVKDAHTLDARFDIVDGYYLYKDKVDFAIKDADGITISRIDASDGIEKDDEFFGLLEVYFNQARLTLYLDRGGNNASTPLTLEATFQGCAEAGLCYPPTTSSVPLVLPASDGTPVIPPPKAEPLQLSEQDQLAISLASGSTWLTIATFFGLGLLLALTPCVFPMIPILSSIIVGQGEHITTRRAFTLSLIYVLAMAITYTIAGVIAGYYGENLQAALQTPWVLISFSIIFVALALSMFGFYDIQLPNTLQTRLTNISNSQQSGTFIGTGIMGFLSALVVGPCVAPPLAGALIYIGQTGDPILGGVALFALSMGMGTPLLAIGTSAGKILPRAGDWMHSIKAVFGVAMLAIAIWMLERIIPESATLALWAILLIGSAIYMGALEQVGVGATGWRKFWKGIGLTMLIYGTLLLIGAASGAKDPLQPLQGISFAAGNPQNQELRFTTIKTVDDLNREINSAKQKGQPVMVDFYADWCISCKEMERYTFSAPGVQKELSGFRLLKADVTLNDEADKALLKHFNLIGPPSIIFYDGQGTEQKHLQLVGFLEAERFQQHVQRVP